jgi:hypothetical protein
VVDASETMRRLKKSNCQFARYRRERVASQVEAIKEHPTADRTGREEAQGYDALDTEEIKFRISGYEFRV